MSGNELFTGHLDNHVDITDQARRAAFRLVGHHPRLTATERATIADALGLIPLNTHQEKKP